MTKAAFEVGKGMREVLTLSEAAVVQYLDPAELLCELEASFGALARREEERTDVAGKIRCSRIGCGALNQRRGFGS
jgi:hypothetical protein